MEWISLGENIQLVMSMSLASGAERFALPSRLLSRLRVCALDAPAEVLSAAKIY
jgi:hypothetical protein